MTAREMRKGWRRDTGDVPGYEVSIRNTRRETLVAFAMEDRSWCWHVTDVEGDHLAQGTAPDEPAAQRAAEDALRGILRSALAELDGPVSLDRLREIVEPPLASAPTPEPPATP